NAVGFDARRIAMSAAVAAMQCKANGARAFSGKNFVVSYLLLEYQSRTPDRKRRDNAELATARATVRPFSAGALRVAEVEDVIVAGGSRQVDRADGIGGKLHLGAALRLALVAGALQDLFGRRPDMLWHRTALCLELSRCGNRQQRRKGCVPSVVSK